MIFRTCENLTLPKAEESFFSDLLVVGGGCSGLAAISAAADLGIENSLLLEKEESLGGRLGKSTEEISGLFGSRGNLCSFKGGSFDSAFPRRSFRLSLSLKG